MQHREDGDKQANFAQLAFPCPSLALAIMLIHLAAIEAESSHLFETGKPPAKLRENEYLPAGPAIHSACVICPSLHACISKAGACPHLFSFFAEIGLY